MLYWDLRSAFLSVRMLRGIELVPKFFLSPVTACAWNILAINTLKHKQTIQISKVFSPQVSIQSWADSVVGHPFTHTHTHSDKVITTQYFL